VTSAKLLVASHLCRIDCAALKPVPGGRQTDAARNSLLVFTFTGIYQDETQDGGWFCGSPQLADFSRRISDIGGSLLLDDDH
jgi:hypothetical protein